jgi:hypothetical protein
MDSLFNPSITTAPMRAFHTTQFPMKHFPKQAKPPEINPETKWVAEKL